MLSLASLCEECMYLESIAETRLYAPLAQFGLLPGKEDEDSFEVRTNRAPLSSLPRVTCTDAVTALSISAWCYGAIVVCVMVVLVLARCHRGISFSRRVSWRWRWVGL